MKISSEYWVGYVNSHTKLRRVAANKMANFLYKNKTASVEEIAAFAYALICKYGEASAALACEMYDSVAAAQANAAQYTPAEPAQFASMDEVAKAVQGAAKRSDTLIPSVVGRLVKQAGADTILQNAARDGAQFAWIPRGDTCAFCITLASRGWQNISKKALKNGHAEHIHANCDCEYAIRFSEKDDVEGYDPEYYQDLYYNSDVGGKPKDKINFLRRELYKENKDRINAQKREAYAIRRMINKIENSNIQTGGINGIINMPFEKASRNYMSNRDGFKTNMAKVPKLDGFQDIACHADANRFEFSDPDTEEVYQVLSAKQFFDRLTKDKVLTDEPIRLFSCESGKYPNGLAQQFANVTGKKILAPTSLVYNDRNGYVVVADSDDEAAIKFVEAYKKRQKWSMDGWMVFSPKE